MSNLSAQLPAKQGVAVYAALKAAADAGIAGGDGRTRGQIMADTLVARVTGQESAPDVPVEVHLVMTDHALLAGDSEPAELIGYGPIPAEIARDWLRDLSDQTRSWLRRFFTYPATGQLQAVETHRRLFTPAQRRALVIRDSDTCRTPWCGAPVRHADHVVAHQAGGVTHLDNGQGLCSTCNHAKQAPGWQHNTGAAGAGEAVRVCTPTGHTYLSRPPPLPQPPPGSQPTSPMPGDEPAPASDTREPALEPDTREPVPEPETGGQCRPHGAPLITTVEIYLDRPTVAEYAAA